MKTFKLKFVALVAGFVMFWLGNTGAAQAQWGHAGHSHGVHMHGAGHHGHHHHHHPHVGYSGYYGPNIYRSAGYAGYGYSGVYVAPRVVVPAPVYPVYRPVVVNPGCEHGYNSYYGGGWGPGYGGSGVSLRVGF